MNAITIEQPDVASIQCEVDSMIMDAQAYEVITTDAQYEAAATTIKQLSNQIKAVKAVFDPMAEAAHAAHKQITSKRAELIAPLERMKTSISNVAGKYIADKKREAEERARQEQARLEAEAQAKRDAEMQARRDAADEAEALGNSETAEVLRLEADTVPAVQVERVAPVLDAPKVQGVSSVTTWDFEITDADEIPRQFLCPDKKAIRAWVKAKKDKAEIPGVRVFSKTTMRA